MSNYCEDCGTKLIENICPNCEEEYFIEKQRLEDEEDDYHFGYNPEIDEDNAII
jgi:hypothetical protein